MSNVNRQFTDYYMCSKYLCSQAQQTEITGWQGFEIIHISAEEQPFNKGDSHPGMCSQGMHCLHTT